MRQEWIDRCLWHLVPRVQELRHAKCQASLIFAQISNRYCCGLSRAICEFVRSFVRSRSAFLVRRKSALRLRAIDYHNLGSLREKSSSAAYVDVPMREKSREITQKCYSIIRRHTIINIDNELMSSYRLNEKRNIQAFSKSYFFSSLPRTTLFSVSFVHSPIVLSTECYQREYHRDVAWLKSR